MLPDIMLRKIGRYFGMTLVQVEKEMEGMTVKEGLALLREITKDEQQKEVDK